ncbi:MAG TPA: class I adenylate-forming enzyme family protein [Acidimicrobiales bacterium]|nr:class I adenylate-forming enzyme family protein [Acidimicrobiales bacterium]
MVETALEMFRVRAERDPAYPFLYTADGVGRPYALLAEHVDALAGTLRAHGAAPGDVVGVYLWNDPAWVVAVLAAWSCGCAFAACGALSPPAEAERRFALVRPRAVVVPTGAALEGGWPLIEVDAEGVAGSEVDAEGDAGPEGVARAAGGADLPGVVPGADDTAAIFFTSGTTAEPKAIVHTHRRLVEGARTTASAYARDAGFRPRTAPGDRPPSISFNPFGHMAALGRVIFRMYVGRAILLVPKFDVRVMRDLAARYPLDTLQLTPAMVHALAYTDEDISLGSLKYVTSGTAPLPMATREEFERRYGVPVLQAYGSTEGGITALERYDDALAGRRGPGSVGRVPEGCPLRIVGPDGRDVAPGDEGEILGRPDPSRAGRYLTEDGTEPLPVDADGWYHTGDVGRVDEHGILYVTGRLKEMLIVGGFNVFPAEVEDALRQSELVRDAVVVPVPDDRLGEVPIAGVVWSGKGPVTVDARLAELTAEARRLLAPYKVPRQWFTLEEVPLTANGKLDRRRAAELGAVALHGAP